MASPIAHTFAGISILALAYPKYARQWTCVLVAMIAACLPDADLLVPWFKHRTVMHSVTFALLFSGLVYWYLGLRNNPLKAVYSGLCLLGILSHLLIDWLSMDLSAPFGLMIGWPWWQDYLISEHAFFLNSRRNDFFTPEIIAHNLRVVWREILIMVPVTVLAITTRRAAIFSADKD